MKQNHFVFLTLAIIGIVFMSGCATTQLAENTTTNGSIPTPLSKVTAKYLIAFHACDTSTTNCNDPRNHKTYIAQSDDGATWSPISGYTAYFGSVPDLIRRGDVLYVFNPGAVRRYTISTDTWEDPLPTPVTVKYANGTSEPFADPSPILDDNGKIVLFYLVGVSQPGQDPAGCLPGQTSCVKAIHSATEVEGSDGTSFVIDESSRADFTITSPYGVSDPDIFKGPDEYLLYISRGPSVQVLSSSTLRGSYTNVAGLQNGMLVSNFGSIQSGYYDPTTKQYWTYIHTPKEGQIMRAVHANVSSPLQDAQFSTIITGTNFPGLGSSYRVESPGFAVNMP